MTMTDTAPIFAARRSITRQRRTLLALPALVLAYLIYAAIAFDVAGVAAKARRDSGALMLQDFWSYKTHVTRQNREGASSGAAVEVAIEGMRQARYAPDQEPDWVVRHADGAVDVALPAGNAVHIAPDGAAVVTVNGVAYAVTPQDDGIDLDIPGPPAWVNVSDRCLSATLPGARVTCTRSKTEICGRPGESCSSLT